MVAFPLEKVSDVHQRREITNVKGAGLRAIADSHDNLEFVRSPSNDSATSTLYWYL